MWQEAEEDYIMRSFIPRMLHH